MPDTAIPVYQTINEKGEATAEIEAVIKALGISLTEKQINTAVNRLSWLNETSGIEREGIVALGNEAADLHRISEYVIGSNSDSAALQLGVQNGESEIFAELQGKLGTVANKILDNFGRSRFLQVIGLADNWACNFGQSFVIWREGTFISENQAISHGLGVVPTMVLASQLQAPNEFFVGAPNAFNLNEVNFAINFVRPRTLGEAAVAFCWLAIG